MLLKIVLAFVPIAVTAMMQTIAMSESISAYSTIVAASSFLTKWRTRVVMRAISSSTEGLGWCMRHPGERRQERTGLPARSVPTCSDRQNRRLVAGDGLCKSWSHHDGYFRHLVFA